jgi:hypothetical protein
MKHLEKKREREKSTKCEYNTIANGIAHWLGSFFYIIKIKRNKYMFRNGIIVICMCVKIFLRAREHIKKEGNEQTTIE